MTDPPPTSPAPASAPPAPIPPWREALRAWEPRRLTYNAVLGVVFIALAARTWSRLAPQLSIANTLRLGVLALIMNLCYSAVYVLEGMVQSLEPRTRQLTRSALWIAGTVFAVLLETYWYLDEILPPLR